jgi:hypothetical protein
VVGGIEPVIQPVLALPVDLRDQRTRPEDRVARHLPAALDALEQERAGLVVAQLHEHADRGLEVRQHFAVQGHQGVVPRELVELL